MRAHTLRAGRVLAIVAIAVLSLFSSATPAFALTPYLDGDLPAGWIEGGYGGGYPGATIWEVRIETSPDVLGTNGAAVQVAPFDTQVHATQDAFVAAQPGTMELRDVTVLDSGTTEIDGVEFWFLKQDVVTQSAYGGLNDEAMINPPDGPTEDLHMREEYYYTNLPDGASTQIYLSAITSPENWGRARPSRRRGRERLLDDSLG